MKVLLFLSLFRVEALFFGSLYEKKRKAHSFELLPSLSWAMPELGRLELSYIYFRCVIIPKRLRIA